jgi:hypothetical protein
MLEIAHPIWQEKLPVGCTITPDGDEFEIGVYRTEL